jgi:hypothetical protein
MDYRRLGIERTAQFAGNLAQTLAAHKVICLPDSVADAFAAQLAGLSSELQDDIQESLELKGRLMAVNTNKQSRQSEIVEILSQVQTMIIGRRGNDEDFDICGFSPRKKWSRVVARTPDKLSVRDRGYGVNEIRFEGNNPVNRVNYEIWRREGKSGPWAMVASIRKQKFIDEPENKNSYYEYKVRAAAATSVSAFSNLGAVNTDARKIKATIEPAMEDRSA